jgi:hypothetical protein
MTSASDAATTALGVSGSDHAAGLDASAASEHATGTLGVDAEASGVGDEDAWVWLGLHLDVLLAKLQEVFGAAGVSMPDLGADADLNVATDGVGVGLVTEDLTVEKSVGVPSVEGLAGDVGLPALP